MGLDARTNVKSYFAGRRPFEHCYRNSQILQMLQLGFGMLREIERIWRDFESSSCLLTLCELRQGQRPDC